MGRLIVIALASIAAAAPALAQDAPKCQQAIIAYRQAAVAVMQNAADIPGALAARANLADEEAAARSACERIPKLSFNIDVMREDIDLALGRAVPACSAAIEAASPHVKAAFEIARSGNQDPAAGSKMLTFLTKARADAEEPCKDYKGVLGRILRAENMMIGIGGRQHDATSENPLSATKRRRGQVLRDLSQRVSGDGLGYWPLGNSADANFPQTARLPRRL